MKTYGKKQMDSNSLGIAHAFSKISKPAVVPASMFTAEMVENIEDPSSEEDNTNILPYRSIETKPSPLNTYSKAPPSIINLISEDKPSSVTSATNSTIDNPSMVKKVDKPNITMFFKNTTTYQRENREILAKLRHEGTEGLAPSYWGDGEDQENVARDLNAFFKPLSKVEDENNKLISTYFRTQNSDVARRLEFDDIENAEKRISYDWKLYKGGIKNLGNSCYMSSIIQVRLYKNYSSRSLYTTIY
jgi:hypothetical protein